MIDFIIKSTLSLSVLLAVYHSTGKEKIHQFNRFYLCLALSFLSIPFITIEVIQESASSFMGTAGIKPGGNHDHHRRFEGLLAYCFGPYMPS
jgi:uncharacterized membrane protein YcaP (DUF421 family)